MSIDWKRLALAALSMTAATAQAAPPPQAGRMESYRDWAVGCDNGLRCKAVSLVPAGAADPQNYASIIVLREAGAGNAPQLRFRLGSAHQGVTDVVIDGAVVASGAASGDLLDLGTPTPAVLQAIANGSRLELRAGDRLVARGSLTGSSAALRYMDARQRRAGTITAIVAKGALGTRAVQAPPALPTAYSMAAPAKAAPELWREEATEAYRLAGCASDGSAPVVHQLPGDRQLVLVPCGAGAYNLSSVALIASGARGRRTFVHAAFDQPPGMSPEGEVHPMLVNARWDAARGMLSEFVKARGIGDCGAASNYVWDGYGFRLTERSVMTECRGAREYLPVYRANVLKKAVD